MNNKEQYNRQHVTYRLELDRQRPGPWIKNRSHRRYIFKLTKNFLVRSWTLRQKTTIIIQKINLHMYHYIEQIACVLRGETAKSNPKVGSNLS